MRRRYTMPLIYAVLSSLVLASSIGAEAPPARTDVPLSGPVKGAPIKRYGVVDEDVLSRSSRPTTAGYAWLRQEGVKNVVNFTDEDPGQGDRILIAKISPLSISPLLCSSYITYKEEHLVCLPP
jgi:hypothetical protein